LERKINDRSQNQDDRIALRFNEVLMKQGKSQLRKQGLCKQAFSSIQLEESIFMKWLNKLNRSQAFKQTIQRL